MGKEKPTVLSKLKNAFIKASESFYYDCTREDLYDTVVRICTNTIKSKDYEKFAYSIATVLFNKVYVAGEVWEPQLILMLIDYCIETLELVDEEDKFMPANIMAGKSNVDSKSLEVEIIKQFNAKIEEFNDEEMMQYILEVK